MIRYQEYYLKNGLHIILHEDTTSPFIVVNTLYKVGAKHEEEFHTGFAHLFEHLMFGGSKHIPDYETSLQLAGGENNAFTSNDVTNYYVVVPKNNIETALWLESDRMLALDFNQNTLDIQKRVVIEEFKESYLNQPYGDVWSLLRSMAYKKHPYKWETIGKKLSHIEETNLEDVKHFFYNHYTPSNAVLVVSGDFRDIDIKSLIDKWYNTIDYRMLEQRDVPLEPNQHKARIQTVDRKVPFSKVFKAFKMGGRAASDYYATDILMDVLGGGESAQLYLDLVKDKSLFSSINAYVLDSFDPGLAVIEGVVTEGVSTHQASKAIDDYLACFVSEPNTIGERELQKIKHKTLLSHRYSNTDILNKSIQLAYAAALGDTNMVNTLYKAYEEVTLDKLEYIKKKILDVNKSSTLIYKAVK